MLQILLIPLRWLVKLVVFLLIAGLLLVWLIPAAFDIPARAAALMERINATRAAGVSINATPASVEGFPPRLILNDVELGAAGSTKPAMVAKETVVQVDVTESITRGEVVVRADILEPQILADKPFSLVALNSALTAALGLTTIVNIVGGKVVTSTGTTVVDLGTVVTTIVPPVVGTVVALLPTPGIPTPGLPIPGLPVPGLPGPGTPTPVTPSPGTPSPVTPGPVTPTPGTPVPGTPPAGPVTPGVAPPGAPVVPPGPGTGPGTGLPGVPGVPVPGVPVPVSPIPPLPPVPNVPDVIDWIRDVLTPGTPTTPPGTTPPGTVPPGTTPPGTTPPGTTPPGTTPPGTVPPGTVPPGVTPPTPVVPQPIGQTPIPVPGQPGMCFCACPC